MTGTSQPFSHQIHEAIYGRRDFDRNVFLKRYFDHNEQVCGYFKDKPNKLLVMDMSAGDGWDELCPFLGVRKPDCDYPRKFVTKDKT